MGCEINSIVHIKMIDIIIGTSMIITDFVLFPPTLINPAPPPPPLPTTSLLVLPRTHTQRHAHTYTHIHAHAHANTHTQADQISLKDCT